MNKLGEATGLNAGSQKRFADGGTKKKGFFVDSLLGFSNETSSPETPAAYCAFSRQHSKSPCQEQNVLLTNPACGEYCARRPVGSSFGDARKRMICDEVNQQSGPVQVGVATGQTISHLQQENCRAEQQQVLSSYWQQPKADLFGGDKQMREVLPTSRRPEPPEDVVGGEAAAAALMPSLAALATYSTFNWCADCSCSFRMTSDLVHHMRTFHKRRRRE